MLLIKITEMTKKYENKVILDKVNMQVNSGESIAIIGRNGMGKSTFLRALAGLTRINSGKVEYTKKLSLVIYLKNFQDWILQFMNI